MSLLTGLAWSLPMQTGRPAEIASTVSTPPVLRFDVEARRGTVTMAGHTRSKRHEDRLVRAAVESFADQQIRTRFIPLGVAPDWWSDATTLLVAALSSLESPTARMRERRLRIEALSADESVSALQLGSLRTVLPESVELSIAIADSGGAVDTADLCERAFARFDHGPVGFEESGVVLLSSAYPILDRVITLADACRDSTISITGHTDASGSDAWNRQLSLARARAVADHLAARGIDRERFIVTGAGSSRPAADNRTPYGRSINRRIDIRFSRAD